MKALVEGLRALGSARLAAMGVVALGMLGMLALMALRGGSEPMALLYGDLDLRDSAQVVDQLARRHIPYRLAGNGSQIHGRKVAQLTAVAAHRCARPADNCNISSL